MFDWKKGGWTGSIRALVAHDILEHRRTNEVYRQSQHSWPSRLMRGLLAGRGFGHFLMFYGVVAGGCMLLQYCNVFDPCWLSTEAKGLIDDAASVLVTIQTGALAMVSIAIGLIALLAEKEGYHADVKIYYNESLAYEVVSSSLSLLLVIGVQVMWPLFELVKALPDAGQDEIYKAPFLAFHIAWLCVNLWAGAHFVACTFHFVDPSRRQKIRQRYMASEVVLPEMAGKLMETFYINVPQGLPSDLKKSAHFGLNIWEGDSVEIRRAFSKPRQLVDVHTRLARWAVARWARRSREATQKEEKRPGTLGDRRPYLSFPMSIGRDLQGSIDICIRRGGVPLSRRERTALRFALKFKAVRAASRTLPAEVQDELAGKVIQSIQALSPLQFDRTLEELLEFHTFLLKVHATRELDGKIANYADVAGLAGRSPQGKWLSAYRRVFQEAITRMVDDAHFIEALTQVPLELLPGPEEQDYSPLVTCGVLDLVPMLVYRVEAWITKRTITEAKTGVHGSAVRSSLAGSDQAVVAQVFEHLVGSWEQLLSMHLHSVAERTSALDRDPIESWRRITEKWPLFQRHMTNSAECLALAVWNEDSTGAHQLRDQLVKWAAGPGIFGQEEVWSPDRRRFYPALLEMPWEVARKSALDVLGETYDGALNPRTALVMQLENLHEDVLFLSAAVFLNWAVNGKQESDIGAETAIELLRQAPESLVEDFYEGRPFTFEMVFGSLIRMALAEIPYSEFLDSLVGGLDGMTERRVISGRIFTPSTLHKWKELREVLLAILIAYLRPIHEAQAWQQLQDIADETAGNLSDDRIRSMTRELQDQIKALKNPQSRPTFSKILDRLRPGEDVDSLLDVAHRFLAIGVAVLDERRDNKISELAVDHVKLESMRSRLEPELSIPPADLAFLEGYSIDLLKNATEGTRYEVRHDETDKALFVSPDMEAPLRSTEFTLQNRLRRHIGEAIWRSFLDQPSSQLNTAAAVDEAEFWESVRQASAQIPGRKALLMGNQDLTTLRGLLRPPGLPGIAFGRRPELATRKHYVVSHGDIDVYRAQYALGTGILFACSALQSIRYTTLRNGGKHLDIQFVPGSEARAPLTLSFVQACQWKPLPVFRLRFRSKRI